MFVATLTICFVVVPLALVPVAIPEEFLAKAFSLAGLVDVACVLVHSVLLEALFLNPDKTFFINQALHAEFVITVYPEGVVVALIAIAIHALRVSS